MSSLLPPHEIATPEASLVQGTNALALHTPDPLLAWPVPMPLFLLAYVPASFKRFYVQTADGLVAASDSRASYRYDLPDGSQFSVDIQGDQAYGLPTQADTDYLLGLFHLADQGYVDLRTGEVLAERRSLRAIVRASFKPEETSWSKENVKMFLRRWGGVHITTRARLDYAADAARVRDGGVPLIPQGNIERRERETSHYVLEYDFERQTVGGQTSEILAGLRINPVWLGHSVAGVTAWLDVATHNGLSSVWAKRMYQVLACRAAQETSLPWTLNLSMPAFLDMLGVRDRSQPLAKQAASITKGCEALLQAGVLTSGSVAPLRGAPKSSDGSHYLVTLTPGPTLVAHGLFRGVSLRDGGQTRLFLSQLRAYGFRPAEARALIGQNPGQVRTMLRRAVYEQVVLGNRVRSWAGWIRSGVEKGYQFDQDADFLHWVEDQERAARTGAEPTLPPRRATTAIDLYRGRGRSALTAAAAAAQEGADATSQAAAGTAKARGDEMDPPLELPATYWGRVLGRVVDAPLEEGGGSRAVQSWLLRAEVHDDTVADDGRRVVTLRADDFTGPWILAKHGELVARCMAAEAHGPATLVVDGKAVHAEWDEAHD